MQTKNAMFCMFFFMLSNNEVYENENTIKQCNFQNSYGVTHRGKFLVFCLYSTFSTDPLDFP